MQMDLTCTGTLCLAALCQAVFCRVLQISRDPDMCKTPAETVPAPSLLRTTLFICFSCNCNCLVY